MSDTGSHLLFSMTKIIRCIASLAINFESEHLIRSDSVFAFNLFCLNILLINLPFRCGNIPTGPVYGVYFSVDSVF